MARLDTRRRKEYTAKEKELIRRTPLSRIKDLAFQLKRSEHALRVHKWRMENEEKARITRRQEKKKKREEELKRIKKEYDREPDSYLGWSKEEVREILDSKEPDEFIALRLGRTVASVRAKRMRVLKEYRDAQQRCDTTR